MTARCEDFPCCGHVDGLPCDWTPPDRPTGPHDYCDHENGFCEIYGYRDEDRDDDAYDDGAFDAPVDTPLALDS